MDIAVTTILLFAVFGILLFVGCPISVSIVVSSIVTACLLCRGIRLHLSPCRK